MPKPIQCDEAAEVKQPLRFDRPNMTPDNGENDEEEHPNFRGVLRHFAENTTCHAPPKVLNHKYTVVKLFWFFCFLGGVGVFCYYFMSLIAAYLKYETTTGTELKFSVLDFPAVTFCNQNRFHKKKLPDSLLSLTDAFLNEKRQDMFGGEDNFQSFQQGVSVGPTTTQAGAPVTATVATGFPATATPAGLVGPAAGLREKKRSTYTMNDDELMTMETLVFNQIETGFQ